MTSAPGLIAVPTGVGSLLQAALQHYRGTPGQHIARRPRRRAGDGRLRDRKPRGGQAAISVDTSRPTSMAGLNCGTVSTIAWPAIRDTPDCRRGQSPMTRLMPAMQRLHELGVPAGPSVAASLAGVRAALGETSQRAALATKADSVVVLISTEGAV